MADFGNDNGKQFHPTLNGVGRRALQHVRGQHPETEISATKAMVFCVMFTAYTLGFNEPSEFRDMFEALKEKSAA